MAWMLAELPELAGLGYRQAVNLAQQLERDGHTAAALPYYRHAAQMRATCFAWSGVARCLRDQGNPEEAVDAFEAAIEDGDANIAPALVGLAQTLVDLGRPMDAVGPVVRLLQTEAPTPPGLYTAARCLRNIADSESVDPGTRDHLLSVADDLRYKAREMEPAWDADRAVKRYERDGWADRPSYLTIRQTPPCLPDSGKPHHVETPGEPPASAAPAPDVDPAEVSDAHPLAASSTWTGPMRWLRVRLRR